MKPLSRVLGGAPKAAQRPQKLTCHGRERSDEYSWLRDAHWQKVMRDPQSLDPEIRAHLEAENAYCAAVLAPAKALRAQLYAEMHARIDPQAASVPLNQGAFAWGRRFEAGCEHEQICRLARDGDMDGDADVVLDFNHEAADGVYFKPGATHPSPDNRYLAWCFDNKGSEYFTLRIRDCESGVDLDDVLVDTGGEFAWSVGADYLFYIALDENHRPARVMRHRVGTKQADDIEVYHEGDAGFFVNIGLSTAQNFIVITAHTHETSEVWLIAADAPQSVPFCVRGREVGVEYEVIDDGARDRLLILTNRDAEDFQIMTLALPLDAARDWEVLVAHQRGHLILEVIARRDYLVWATREAALPVVHIYDYARDTAEAIDFDEEAYDVSLIEGFEYGSVFLRFIYASMATPRETYDYDMGSRRRILRMRQFVPSGHDSADYVARRLFISGHDGAAVPVSLLYRKGTVLDGCAPLLLYGYGAYGITIPAGFETSRLSLVDRGFIYAIAHIRGGRACGHHWFMGGRGVHKTNSFDDFISVGRGLIELGFTGAGRICVHGGSAGGLLVGASLNRAPGLFSACVAEVPFVDVLTTMLDASLPLTPPEWPEWGNPIESAADYDIIANYSPYDNIGHHEYPHILATAGLTDPRVTYWEPAKWVARLRARRSDDGLTLLHTEMDAGHGGMAGRYKRLHEIAIVYSFLLLAQHEEIS